MTLGRMARHRAAGWGTQARGNASALAAGGVELPSGQWHHIAATYDGATARLYLDGRPCGVLAARTSRVAARIDIAPIAPGAAVGAPHFGGSLAGLTLEPYALDAQAVRLLAKFSRISRS